MKYYYENYIDLFINLSESEGIPVSIMEALSAGIPVLATNVGGTKEAVNNDNGFMIDKDLDLEKVCKLISKYFGVPLDQKKEKRQNAKLYWEEHFNAKKNYKHFEKIILS